MKKYEFMNEFVEVGNKRLFRIRATENFGNVSVGDVGGYLENEENLSQKHSCWVSGQAKVYDRAKVSGDAKVSGYAEVFDDARICGNARVSGWAKVGGKSVVDDDQEIGGNDYVGTRTEKEIAEMQVVSETPFESLDVEPEQIKFTEPEIVVKKEITGSVPDGLFSIGYSTPLGTLWKILSAGRALDKDNAPTDARKDITITLGKDEKTDKKGKADKNKKTKIIKAKVNHKGLDLRINFNFPISWQGDKNVADTLVFLSKKIREQCWNDDAFVTDEVIFSVEELLAEMQYKRTSSKKYAFTDPMKVLIGIQIGGSASQAGETKIISELPELKSLFCDWHEEDGIFHVFIDPRIWSVLTAQRLILPCNYFDFDGKKLEIRLLHCFFETVKKELAKFGADARKFSIPLNYLCRRAGLPVWDRNGADYENMRVVTAMKNIEQKLKDVYKITGISVRVKYGDIKSEKFLKDSCVDVSVLKATAVYYKEIDREVNYNAILMPAKLQPYSEKKEIADDLSLKTETKSLTLEDIWAGIDARVKARKHETTTP